MSEGWKELHYKTDGNLNFLLSQHEMIYHFHQNKIFLHNVSKGNQSYVKASNKKLEHTLHYTAWNFKWSNVSWRWLKICFRIYKHKEIQNHGYFRFNKLYTMGCLTNNRIRFITSFGHNLQPFPSPVMVTSPNEWEILTCDAKQQINNLKHCTRKNKSAVGFSKKFLLKIGNFN